MPRPIDAWISAAQATALLGVKRATLYTYASRGLVRSRPGPGRTRTYARDDVLALRRRADDHRGHAPRAATALDWGNPVVDSAITDIDPDGPAYRGVLAIDLADQGATLEQVAALLWQDPASAAPWTASDLGLPEAAWLDLGALRPLDRLATALPAMAVADPSRWAAGRPAELARARLVLVRLAACLAGSDARHALTAGSLSATLARALGTPDTASLDLALVLLADHELNASTFAARVAASSGADLYACLSAGLAALSGPRHGAASERVEAFLAEVAVPDRAAAAVAARLARGDALPGLGHRLYPDGDPRLPPLLARARALRRDPLLEAVLTELDNAGQPPPNVDVGLIALCRALDLPGTTAAAVFAIARAVGWIAHVLEQRDSGELIRPRARYTDPHDARSRR